MKNKLLYILVFVLFLIGLFIRLESVGIGLDHPGNLKAGNAFYHTILPTYVAEGSNIFTYPANLAEGHDDIINIVSQHQALIIAPLLKLTGIEDWNLSVLVVAIISAFSIPLMFILTKKVFNSDAVAILSTALLAIPLNLVSWLHFTYIGVWLQSSAMTFILASLLLTYLIYEKSEAWKIFALSITSSALFLLFPIALIITIPLLIAVLIKILKANDKSKNILLYIVPVIIVLIIALPVYYIGYFTRESYTNFGITSLEEQKANRDFITDFSSFPIVITILFALGCLQLLLNYKKYKGIILFVVFYFALMFLGPTISSTGIAVYIIRMWSTLPYIVFPIVAYGTHFMIIKNISKISNINQRYILALLLIILFVFGITQFNNLKNSLKYEHVTKAKYDALKWVQENTEEDSKIFMLEGSYQTEAAYTKRLTYQVTGEELNKKINEVVQTNNLNLVYNSGWFQVASWSKHRYKTGYLSYDNHTPLNTTQLMIDFDYIYLENLNDVVKEYNLLVVDALTKNFNFEIAYDKAGYIILKKK